MRYDTIGRRLIRWLIIWAVLFVVMLMASVMTHWDLFSAWFAGMGNKVGYILQQVFIWGVVFAMLLGAVRRG